VADMAVADMVCGRYGRTPSVTPNLDFKVTVLL